MPIVKTSDLPTFDRLQKQGYPVLSRGRAERQDIRELHIGFCNLMPDTAMEATERQWYRLIGESNRVTQIIIHPFTLDIFDRGKNIEEHISHYYDTPQKIRDEGLDALVITGANEETNPHVSDINTWGPLKELLEWSYENVTSTLCSCLTSHALLTYAYGQKPHWRDNKKWGVFTHRLTDRSHPLTRGMNTKFDVPHSRYSEIGKAQFEAAGMNVLAETYDDCVHMAVSRDGLRRICLQGHPEYDSYSLFKEYKRDIGWFMDGKLENCPPVPENYFGPKAEEILKHHLEEVKNGKKPDFPEADILPLLENTWSDSARSFIAGWIGHVYNLTHFERGKPFMDGIDPDDPFGMRT